MREILLLALVALSIPLCFTRPLWGLAIYLGANVVRPEMLFWGGDGGAYVFRVYFFVMVAAVLAKGYLSRAQRLVNREFLLMVWLFLAVLVSSLFAQYQVFRDDYYIFEILTSFLVCALIYLIVNDFEELRSLLKVLLWCFAFLGVWGIDQHFRGNERLEGLGGSAWGDSNGVATIFVLFLPLAFARFMTSTTRRERGESLFIIAIMVILIVCTQSRAGLLGLVVCLGSYGFYTRKLRKMVPAALFMALVALPFATDAYLERMKTMESEENLDGSARSRFILWQAGLMVFSDNPLFGTGFLTYPEAKMKYKDRFPELEDTFREWVFRKEDKKVTHNTYVQVMSDCGLFGAIPYFLLILGGVRSGFQARRLVGGEADGKGKCLWLAALAAGITGFAVCIITLDTLLVTFPYFQLVLIGTLSRLTVPGNAVASPPLPVGARGEP